MPDTHRAGTPGTFIRSDEATSTALPLSGVRVIDISSSYAAPTTSMYLADMGADVVKVEPIRGDDARGWGPPFLNGEAAWFLSVNRNKRSVCLDITTPAGHATLMNLLESADVFVENLTPAKLAKHGLALDALAQRFPALVICALSGYGLDGPDSALPGYDLIAQARSGLMSVTGPAGGAPQRVSTALSDVAAGTIAAFAVSSALVRQRTTGVGEIIDISLLEADLAFLSPRIASYLAGEPEPHPSGGTDSVVAIYQSFETVDRPIVVAIGNDRHWLKACRVLGLEHLSTQSDLATNAGRRDRRQEIVRMFQDVFSTVTADRALEMLQSVGVPSSRIQRLSEVVADPQVVARQGIVKQDHPVAGPFESVASPWKLASDPNARTIATPAPLKGQHTREVLAELDLEDEQIDELIREGVAWSR
ncbi:CaiB/BaiF CoA transferase family protein [Nocardia sp. CA-107356]|uniref:CaiB/BaiF CoA transferase family protein n=1 Tax=Nocardia sp. CA-107356 TaxID=3239972 RepID=UPI003D92CA7E